MKGDTEAIIKPSDWSARTSPRVATKDFDVRRKKKRKALGRELTSKVTMSARGPGHPTADAAGPGTAGRGSVLLKTLYKKERTHSAVHTAISCALILDGQEKSVREKGRVRLPRPIPG